MAARRGDAMDVFAHVVWDGYALARVVELPESGDHDMTGALHTIALGLFRRTWIVGALAATMCAGFAAHAASSLMAEPRPDPHGALTPHAPPAEATPSHQRPDAHGFVERNMFCSTCGSAEPAPGTMDTYSPTAAVLIETSVGDDSSATVRVVASDVQGRFALGQEIPGLGAIAAITRGWIDVQDAHGLHRMELAKATIGKPQEVAGSSGAATPESPFADRVHKVDDHTYEADRGLFKELVAGVTKPGGVRATPVIENGEVKGIKILGVSAASIPAAFGLKSGDTLTAIDGDPLKNANQVLELYAKIDTTSSVELSGMRGGKPLALTLRLR